jgi:hypothetical protein
MRVNESERTKGGLKHLTVDTCFAQSGYQVVVSERDVGFNPILLCMEKN